MTPENQSFSRSALIAFAVYLVVCGVSAICFPVTWLWSAGLSTSVSPELRLVFGVLGAYLLALAAGSWIASRHPSEHQGIILVLLVSQVLDFLLTLKAVFDGVLPRFPGTAFLVGTVVWSTLLSIAWRQTRRRK